MRSYVVLVFIVLISISSLKAQKTVVLGKITEATTNIPVPYVNIVFKDTYTGTTSDLNGNYNLSSTKPTSVVEFSAVGYKKQSFKIKLNQVNRINVTMVEDVISLGEISVRPGENPAIPLFRKIVSHKKENNPSNFPSWQSRLYAKSEIDIKNVNRSLSKKKLLKQFEFVFKYIDSLENFSPCLFYRNSFELFS
jgi:CarboxypepD_reg-like domain